MFVDSQFIHPLKHHLTLLVRQFAHSVIELFVLVDKLISFIVEWCTTHTLCGIVELNHDFSLLKNYRHNALVVHKEICHPDSVENAVEMELSVNNVTRINTLQLVVFYSFEIQFATVERRYRRRTLYVVRIGT